MKEKIMAIVIIGLMIAIGFISGCTEVNNTTLAGIASREFNVFATDAPAGRYWIQESGSSYHSLFVCYSSFGSELQESYTIKFMVDDVVKTVILSSRDNRLNVHLTDDNTSMKLVINCTDYDGAIYPGCYYESFVNNQDDAGKDLLFYVNGGTTTYYNLFNGYGHSLTGNGFLYDFNLYIPRLDICVLSNETIG